MAMDVGFFPITAPLSAKSIEEFATQFLILWIQIPLHRSAHSPKVSTTHSGPSSSTKSGATERIGRQRWRPFNTLLWILFELIFTLGQIIAAFIVLSISEGEKP